MLRGWEQEKCGARDPGSSPALPMLADALSLLLGCHAFERWMSVGKSFSVAVQAGPESQHHSGQAFLFGIFASCHNVVIFPAQGFQALPYRWLGSFLCGGIPYTKYTLLVYFHAREEEIEATNWWLSFCPHDHVSTTIQPGPFSPVCLRSNTTQLGFGLKVVRKKKTKTKTTVSL